MTVSAEILAAQQAYAARPYAASVRTGTFSGTFRFDTYDQAVAYLRQQVRANGRVGREKGWASKGVQPRETYVIMPDGTHRDLAACGVAVCPQGPGVPDWIIL